MALRAAGLAYARESRNRIPAPRPVADPRVQWKPGHQCDVCRYREVCTALVRAHLPVLCERLEEGEMEKLEEVAR